MAAISVYDMFDISFSIVSVFVVRVSPLNDSFACSSGMCGIASPVVIVWNSPVNGSIASMIMIDCFFVIVFLYTKCNILFRVFVL